MSNPFNTGDPSPQQPPQQPPQQHFSARVPEKVGRGVYCTGQIIHDSPKEFVIDFLQGLNRPFQVVARVVMAPQTMLEFISTFQQNLDNYVRQFGPPTMPNTPPPDRRPGIEEIYEHYKLADDAHSGTYCNTVIIGHAPTEFLFDFATAFYPSAAIGARVILPAGQAPKFLNTLRGSMQQFQQRHAGQPAPPQPQLPQPPGQPPAGAPPQQPPPGID
ncbi:MAG TPA: DUF3467 domain-containing protein [Tepidisphaeraceae bacterium]|nr:DUF3467 domain-containing protein [Tepidisphaeraceae bacterium]